jgi:GntR family transcriptional repressor for pyruvate dehydrogenase complex
VREGLRFLEKLGILEIRQGTGTVVRSLSLGKVFEHPVPVQTITDLPDRDVRDIMRVRRILEAESGPTGGSARHPRAASTSGGAARRDGCLPGKNPRDYLEMDLEFHVVVVKASSNSVLAQFINLIGGIYTRYFEIVLRDPEMNKTSLDFHRRLYAALRDHDADAARQHILAHLSQAERDVLRLLDDVDENVQTSSPA